MFLILHEQQHAIERPLRTLTGFAATGLGDKVRDLLIGAAHPSPQAPIFPLQLGDLLPHLREQKIVLHQLRRKVRFTAEQIRDSKYT